MTNLKPIRIAILYQEEIFRLGLELIINRKNNYQLIHHTHDPKLFLANTISNTIDVVIIDNELINNGKLIRKIKSKSPQTRIIVLTNNSSSYAISRLYKLSVHGVLLKKTSSDNIINAIGCVYKNKFWNNELAAQALRFQLCPEIKLTCKEFQFIELCCSERTYAEIAQQMFISINTIDKDRNNVFKKLKIKSRISLMVYAITNGLVTFENKQINYA